MRYGTALRYSLRSYYRSPFLLALLLFLPIAFVALSFAVTPSGLMTLDIGETVVTADVKDIDGLLVAPFTATFLAGVIGLFLMLASVEADRRLVLSGFRPGEVVLARLSTLAIASAYVSLVSTGAVLLHYPVGQPLLYGVSLLLRAYMFGCIGMLIGTYFGKTGGTYLVFLAITIDITALDPRITLGEVPDWATYLPGYHPNQVLLDAALTGLPDTLTHLVLSLDYAAIVTLGVMLVFRRRILP
ncbi:MAG: hypothetical protein MAG715_00331 [Methanonatronarchaeales archaeon]|nr:hypothetical protein [Methanonatronarchaeales archaeon]